MEDKIRGLRNGRVIIRRDFDRLETELEEPDFYSRNDHRGYLGSPPIRYKKSSGSDPITMDLLPPGFGFLEPLYTDIMDIIKTLSIKFWNLILPDKLSKWSRMAPKRTSTSAVPAMTQTTIRKLVADSVATSQEAQAAWQMLTIPIETLNQEKLL
nr:hypothetical protein [Tanacetum cinerariifolium]